MHAMAAAALCRAPAWCVLAVALTATAQTNSSPPNARWFALPEPRLRCQDTPPQPSRDAPQPQEVEGRSQPARLEPPASDTGGSEPAVVATDRSDQDFQLSSPVQKYADALLQVRPPDDALGRFLDSTFRPEPLKVGKVEVSCSILTAIKHKNPFCLLNPIFLNFSW